MKKEYGKHYYVVKADQVERHFDDNGFSRTELLPGIYDGGIRSYKCFLKAGCKVSPELYKDKGVVILFGQGKGVLKDQDGDHAITELAFYVNHKAGDWSFIPAGADHDLVSEPGKEVYYVWLEHFTDEKKFAKPEN